MYGIAISYDEGRGLGYVISALARCLRVTDWHWLITSCSTDLPTLAAVSGVQDVAQRIVNKLPFQWSEIEKLVLPDEIGECSIRGFRHLAELEAYTRNDRVQSMFVHINCADDNTFQVVSTEHTVIQNISAYFMHPRLLDEDWFRDRFE